MKKRPSQPETGVIIDEGPRDWQILQQSETGGADIRMSGRWVPHTSNPGPFKRVRVMVRVLSEDYYEPATRDFDWKPAATRKDGTWSITLKGLPAGGLYRIETGLQLDNGPLDWLGRGDMVHHVGVGDIWVITGQSNSGGHGRQPVHDPPEPGVHMLHARGEWKLASHPLGDSTGMAYGNLLYLVKSHTPWLSFAKRLKRSLAYPIGLLPTALGGSSMQQWDRKEDGFLFRSMLDYIADAGGRVRGAVWYQGESNASASQMQYYERGFKRFVADLRKSAKAPELPVITAQLNRCVGGEGNGWELMREMQRKLARDMSNVYIAPTFGSGLIDVVHNNSAGNLVIGQRMAAVALGGVYGRNIKYRFPEIRFARIVSSDRIDLVFDNVDTALNITCPPPNTHPAEFPFAVRDAEGNVAVAAFRQRGPAKITLELARPTNGTVTVIGMPGANPPAMAPMDIADFAPMLGFVAEARKA